MIDVYGLLWCSDKELRATRAELSSMVDREKVSSVVSSFKGDEYASVARNLGIGVNELSATIAELRQES